MSKSCTRWNGIGGRNNPKNNKPIPKELMNNETPRPREDAGHRKDKEDTEVF